MKKTIDSRFFIAYEDEEDLYELDVDELKDLIQTCGEGKPFSSKQIKEIKKLIKDKKIYATVLNDYIDENFKDHKVCSLLYISLKRKKDGEKMGEILGMRFDDSEESKPYYMFESE